MLEMGCSLVQVTDIGIFTPKREFLLLPHCIVKLKALLHGGNHQLQITPEVIYIIGAWGFFFCTLLELGRAALFSVGSTRCRFMPIWGRC